MKDKSYIKLKCIFCGSEDFSLPEKNYEPQKGEKIKCANCGKLNDYEALQNQAIENARKIINGNLIDYVKIVNRDVDTESNDIAEESDNEDKNEYIGDDSDYELNNISDKLEELKEDEKEYGRCIADDLEILSDYFDLMDEGGLTKSEFEKYKSQCIKRLKTKQYVSAPKVDSKAMKFAHSLLKLKCITNDEYDMIKHRIEQLPIEEQQREEEKRERDLQLFMEQEKAEAEAREEIERQERLNYIWELIKVVLYILSIPFRIILWLSEVCLFGYKEVWKRDEMERIMRERDKD